VSRPSEKVVFRVKTESGYQENQLAASQTELHYSESRTIVERTDSNAGRFASYRRHPQTVPKAGSGYLVPRRLHAFPVEKANDHSLL
jgi:hypothetical protein